MVRTVIPLALLLVFGQAVLAGQELQFAKPGDCTLESGEVIRDCRIGYRVAGNLDPDRSNAILLLAWFGGTSETILGLLGPEGMIDPSEDYVIAVDAFGNGVSSSPSNSSLHGGSAFPRVTIRDMVRQQRRMLEEHFGISSLKAVVGISMGGMQAFEWAVSYPGFAEKIIPVVGSPRLAAYDIVFWETDLEILAWFLECRCQSPAAVRQGLYFLAGGPDYHARVSPLESLPSIRDRLASASLSEGRVHDLAVQLHAMIGHDVSAPFDGSLERAAEQTQAEFLIVVGLEDHLVTPGPALEFAQLVGARTLELSNDCGHQAPWCEEEVFNSAVREFLSR
jgi:homoserine O-acetyltransferase